MYIYLCIFIIHFHKYIYTYIYVCIFKKIISIQDFNLKPRKSNFFATPNTRNKGLPITFYSITATCCLRPPPPKKKKTPWNWQFVGLVQMSFLFWVSASCQVLGWYFWGLSLFPAFSDEHLLEVFVLESVAATGSIAANDSKLRRRHCKGWYFLPTNLAWKVIWD